MDEHGRPNKSVQITRPDAGPEKPIYNQSKIYRPGSYDQGFL